MTTLKTNLRDYIVFVLRIASWATFTTYAYYAVEIAIKNYMFGVTLLLTSALLSIASNYIQMQQSLCGLTEFWAITTQSTATIIHIVIPYILMRQCEGESFHEATPLAGFCFVAMHLLVIWFMLLRYVGVARCIFVIVSEFIKFRTKLYVD